jgi:hypothetical protein
VDDFKITMLKECAEDAPAPHSPRNSLTADSKLPGNMTDTKHPIPNFQSLEWKVCICLDLKNLYMKQ